MPLYHRSQPNQESTLWEFSLVGFSSTSLQISILTIIFKPWKNWKMMTRFPFRPEKSLQLWLRWFQNPVLLWTVYKYFECLYADWPPGGDSRHVWHTGVRCSSIGGRHREQRKIRMTVHSPMTRAWTLTLTHTSSLVSLSSSTSSHRTPSWWAMYSHVIFRPPGKQLVCFVLISRSWLERLKSAKSAIII